MVALFFGRMVLSEPKDLTVTVANTFSKYGSYIWDFFFFLLTVCEYKKSIKWLFKIVTVKIEQLYVWLPEITSCKAEISYSGCTHNSENSCCVEFCDSTPSLYVEVIRVFRKLNACCFWVIPVHVSSLCLEKWDMLFRYKEWVKKNGPGP